MILQNANKNTIVLKISEIKPYNSYSLVDDNKNSYSLCLEFYGLNKPLVVGDKLLINKDLLNPHSINYTQPYAFTIATNQLSAENPNRVILQSADKEIEMERIYG